MGWGERKRFHVNQSVEPDGRNETQPGSSNDLKIHRGLFKSSQHGILMQEKGGGRKSGGGTATWRKQSRGTGSLEQKWRKYLRKDNAFGVGGVNLKTKNKNGERESIGSEGKE